MENFKSDFAVVLEVVGKIDGGHSSATELALDIVLSVKRLLQLLQQSPLPLAVRLQF